MAGLGCIAVARPPAFARGVAISPSLRAHSSVNLYLQVFNGLLGLSRDFSAAELEDVLVASVGDEGLLPDIHMVCC